MSERADQHCAKCYGRTHDGEESHEFVPVFDTRFSDEVFCPWCGARNSSDELMSGGLYDCEECEREFSVEIDYDPSYTTARLTCYCCGGEMPASKSTKLGGDNRACSDECLARCNAAYDEYRAAYLPERRNEFPRKGFGKQANTSTDSLLGG